MPGDDVTIVYPTHRAEPRFEWFADSLAAQLGDDAPDVVVVDGLHSAEREAASAAAVAHRFACRHVPAKPTPYNGRHRRTRRREYFAGASARNTGIAHARGRYLVFADDLAVLMPGWWDEVKSAATGEYVVAGAYQKWYRMNVEAGALVAGDAHAAGLDTRWELGEDAGPVQISGGQLYGSSMGMPRELLVEVNGLDELCDSIGGEDCDLGLRIEFLGEPVLYSRRMLTIESEEGHVPHPGLARMDATLGEDAYMALLREHGVAGRSTDGRLDSAHFLLDRALGTRAPRSAGNRFDLATLTPAQLEATAEDLPTRHWFTGEPLEDL